MHRLGVSTPAVGSAKKHLTDSRFIWISQLMHGWLNAETQKEKMGEDPMCPCCGQCIEDSLHIYQCEHTAMRKTFDNQMKKMNPANGAYMSHLPTPLSCVFGIPWPILGQKSKLIVFRKPQNVAHTA
jgi:hypothetical protein